MGLKPDNHRHSFGAKASPGKTLRGAAVRHPTAERSQEALAALKQKIWRELMEKLDGPAKGLRPRQTN